MNQPINEWIRERLAALEMTQKDAAEILDMSPQNFAYYACGSREPSLKRTREFCNLFGPYTIEADDPIKVLKI